MGAVQAYCLGGGVGGQDATVLLPKRWRLGSHRLIVFCHGAGLAWNANTDHAVSWPELRTAFYYLAERGYMVVNAPLYDASLGVGAGNAWGNDVSTSQLMAVIAWAKSNGARPGNYALLPGSMGNITAMNYARRVSYTGIAGVLGLIPACTLSQYRGTDAAQGGNYADVNAALFVANGSVTVNDAAFTTLQATYAPNSIAPHITFPWDFWSNSDDIVAPAAAMATTAALIPGGLGNTLSLGTGGHNFNNVTGPAVYAWMEKLPGW